MPELSAMAVETDVTIKEEWQRSNGDASLTEESGLEMESQKKSAHETLMCKTDSAKLGRSRSHFDVGTVKPRRKRKGKAWERVI